MIMHTYFFELVPSSITCKLVDGVVDDMNAYSR